MLKGVCVLAVIATVCSLPAPDSTTTGPSSTTQGIQQNYNRLAGPPPGAIRHFQPPPGALENLAHPKPLVQGGGGSLEDFRNPAVAAAEKSANTEKIDDKESLEGAEFGWGWRNWGWGGGYGYPSYYHYYPNYYYNDYYNYPRYYYNSWW